ncbi:antibiotic biosynthesis monooxygenase [Nonomuraea sp. NPDC000554]|uniref:putative quinol monooxygenase n=1 Tax=Nonomuraea sp. NPDC000554 TaxID=3154259 RepID=UPI00331F07EE
MEILVAVIAFAGALLAAIAAGALIRRLRDDPEGWLIAWTVAAVALCVSLGVIGVGYLMGFGTATFKIYQLTGSLLAPLWLGIGLIQLLSEKAPPKFAAWLYSIAITITASVILVADPLLNSGKMTKLLPTGSGHWGLIPDKLLLGVHVVDVLVLLAAAVFAGLRWRNGDEYDTDNLHAVAVIAPSGIALIGAMRFSVPGIFTTALFVVAAAAIWYCVLRPLAPYEDDEDEVEQERRPSPRRAAAAAAEQSEPTVALRSPMPQPMPQPMPPPVVAPEAPPAVQPRRSGLGDLVAEYRAGDQEVDYAARMTSPPDAGPSTGYIMNGRHGGGPAQQDVPRQDYSMPGTGAVYPGAELFSTGPHQAQPQQQPGSGKPSPSIYGLLTVFTLMDGSGAAFDRLAEQTVEAVRRGEPDTLVYACHGVKSAPLQRIVYELYRDEVAYRDHQRQPHVERFLNERQAMVLATNVIELNVNAAKVVPLPTAMY